MDNDQEDDLPQAFERRAFIRYPRILESIWGGLGGGGSDLTSCQIQNLSATGVCFLADREFQPNTSLVIRLPSSTLGWVTYLVRVKNCLPGPENNYEIGCSFARPLSGKQLRAHLE
ncbi:MAG: PilZ domain-containing protein [Gemmataceae bacterium]